MSTTQQRLLDRIDLVAKASVPTGVTVNRERADAQSREEAPAVNVQPEDGNAEAWEEMDLREFIVLVDIYVRAEPGAMACDDIHGPLHTALMLDAELQSLAVSRRLVAWEFEHEAADVTSTHKRCRYAFRDLYPKQTL